MNCDGHITKHRHGQALKAELLQPLGDALATVTVTQHYTPHARETPAALRAAVHAHTLGQVGMQNSTHTFFVKVTQKTAPLNGRPHTHTYMGNSMGYKIKKIQR